jgi:hypothetical protein
METWLGDELMIWDYIMPALPWVIAAGLIYLSVLLELIAPW